MVTRAGDAGPGAREIAHTADLGFEVEAPTLGLLFERAGLALLSVMADLDGVAVRRRLPVALAGTSVAELLHDWLQALVVQVQADAFLACELDVRRVDDGTLEAVVGGEPIDRARHRLHTEVKGVTYHELAVAPRGAGWWARVIVDV